MTRSEQEIRTEIHPTEDWRGKLLPKIDRKDPRNVAHLNAFLLGVFEQEYASKTQVRRVHRHLINHHSDFFERGGPKSKFFLHEVVKQAVREIRKRFDVEIPYEYNKPILEDSSQYAVRELLDSGGRVVIADKDEAYYLIGATVEGLKVRPSAIDPHQPKNPEKLPNRRFLELLKNGWISIPVNPNLPVESSLSPAAGEVFNSQS